MSATTVPTQAVPWCDRAASGPIARRQFALFLWRMLRISRAFGVPLILVTASFAVTPVGSLCATPPPNGQGRGAARGSGGE